ncbi:MAG TPA: YkoF family thiamine/hydroxymethylpyrimidine-binding protein [Anaerolineae bacterium]|nr:YkoF family thiamine/hydroxymethylpyrimidine-binding protein [Anaerolineae bacterium]
MGVAAQFSVYPLGQAQLEPAIEAVWGVLRAHGLHYQAGSMSTRLEGNEETVFAALHDAFQAAAQFGGTVMTITISNACPPLRRPPQEIAAHA